MGCLPAVLPGYQPVTDKGARERFSEKWGAAVPAWTGKNSPQMMTAAKEGKIKALYIWGEDPGQTHGDLTNIREALSSLNFLVYQDLFFTKTAELAHVVLPASSFAEKEGTFANTERRVRLLRRAIPPVGSSRPDWEIFQELSSRLGLPTDFNASSEVYDEMASLCDLFRGISHRRLLSHGIQWPCTDESHPGTVRLYTEGFPQGRASFFAIPYRKPSEKVTAEFPLILTTGRRLYHFNNAAQTRRTPTAEQKEEALDMHPRDMTKLNLAEGQTVKIVSRRGEVEIPVRKDASIMEGVVFASFHDPNLPINLLTGGAGDSYTDTYSYKFTAVRVEAH
jgi:formate dehydrogenase alpha subunit